MQINKASRCQEKGHATTPVEQHEPLFNEMSDLCPHHRIAGGPRFTRGNHQRIRYIHKLRIDATGFV